MISEAITQTVDTESNSVIWFFVATEKHTAKHVPQNTTKQ